LHVCDGTGALAGRCYHGVGHGLMFYFNNDLPTALTTCDTYKENDPSSPRNHCYEGVFMQNFLSDPDAPLVLPSKYLDPKNPFYPCGTESAKFKPYCYFYAPILFLNLHNDDYSAALSWCNSAERDGILACVRGVGSLTMKYNIKDPVYVESICMQATPAEIPSCIDGMVSYYLTFSFSSESTKNMCLQLQTQDQPDCMKAIKRRVNDFVD
ncbi:MAG: hypothetical protein ACREGC_02450, partial [Minisyncoccia bacterium]